ncbi:autotransporter outer membrane beta-barrel domain-containing protein [Shimia sediminis]|uniref:autotransporter outer membrane beta-barrel domain-containing protein n=1 Tax=Shimia sediminis TaxID=2497945 RepID=UPI000F8D719A|nr:autotransporter outer membrane beta-barrel domain-containing protein [Shimia sediminis]
MTDVCARMARMAGVISVVACAPAVMLAEGAGDAPEPAAEEAGAVSGGILPQLAMSLRLPENLQLRYPNAPQPTEEPVIYDRVLPFFGQKAVDRGYTLPLPFGISVIGVGNEQAQEITDVAVALGKGAPPPPGTELKDLPFVTLENVVSDTTTKQIKLDAWILPNINVFGAIGRVEGVANLDVVVDLDTAFPPPICTPVDPCGSVTANFDAGVDATTVTLGASAVYGWDNFFLVGSAAFTDTLGDSSDTVIRSVSGSLRFGRNWIVGNGIALAPYVGVSYLDYDEEIEGVTKLEDAFPDGDSLDVRYRANSTNVDKWSGVLGLNMGFRNGVSVQGEYNKSASGDRVLVSLVQRF